MARFWLERGVDGFRLDTINFYFCDRELRDNPALPPERRDYSTAPAVNPYNWQEHLYDKSRPEMIGFLTRLRALMDEFGDIAAVGEVGDAQRGMEIMGEYTRGDDLMQMCYAFEFLSPEAPSGRRVGQVLRRFAHRRRRRLGLLGLLQPRRRAARHALAPRRRAAPGLSRAAAVAARLGLPLPGRGARADRGLRAVRGAAGPLRQAVLAEVPRPRRLPDADALAQRHDVRAASPSAKPWLPVAMEHVPMAVSVQDADPDSMLGLLPADAGVAEDAAGAGQGRLHAATRPRTA